MEASRAETAELEGLRVFLQEGEPQKGSLGRFGAPF